MTYPLRIKMRFIKSILLFGSILLFSHWTMADCRVSSSDVKLWQGLTNLTHCQIDEGISRQSTDAPNSRLIFKENKPVYKKFMEETFSFSLKKNCTEGNGSIAFSQQLIALHTGGSKYLGDVIMPYADYIAADTCIKLPSGTSVEDYIAQVNAAVNFCEKNGYKTGMAKPKNFEEITRIAHNIIESYRGFIEQKYPDLKPGFDPAPKDFFGNPKPPLNH